MFNDALLAKQAWQLIHHQNSLFYKIFKAKFFPHYSIMDASESTSGSHAWKSILKGRDVLSKGARWRVGCEGSISIWLDAWLPSASHPRIMSPIVLGFEDAKVSDLINPVPRKWEEHLLQGLFIPQEVELIKSIPLCHAFIEDKLKWPFTPTGQYIVKSGYNFLAKKNSAHPYGDNSSRDKRIWN